MSSFDDLLKELGLNGEDIFGNTELLRQYIERSIDDPSPLQAFGKLEEDSSTNDSTSQEVASSSIKRHRREIDLATKKAIIEASATESNQTKLAKLFNIPRTTIAGILKGKEGIESAIDAGHEVKRSRLSKGKYLDVEKALLAWCSLQRSTGQNVNGVIVKRKAKELADLLNIDDFRASNGWLENFKHRHHLSFKEQLGEANLACPTMHEDLLTVIKTEPKAPSVTKEQAQEAMATLRLFVQQKQFRNPEILRACDKLEEAITITE